MNRETRPGPASAECTCICISLAGQTFAARGGEGGTREGGKRTSGHYRQVSVAWRIQKRDIIPNVSRKEVPFFEASTSVIWLCVVRAVRLQL